MNGNDAHYVLPYHEKKFKKKLHPFIGSINSIIVAVGHQQKSLFSLIIQCVPFVPRLSSVFSSFYVYWRRRETGKDETYSDVSIFFFYHKIAVFFITISRRPRQVCG